MPGNIRKQRAVGARGTSGVPLAKDPAVTQLLEAWPPPARYLSPKHERAQIAARDLSDAAHTREVRAAPHALGLGAFHTRAQNKEPERSKVPFRFETWLRCNRQQLPQRLVRAARAASRRPDCTLSQPCPPPPSPPVKGEREEDEFRPTAGDPVDRGSTTPPFPVTRTHARADSAEPNTAHEATVAFRRSDPAGTLLSLQNFDR
jgi:hypothetical protein